MTTQHRVNEPPSSNTGVKVMPRLTVFHKPPNAEATYQVLGFFESIATSAMRPVASAGPMLRSSRPFKASADRRSALGPWRALSTPVAATPTTAAINRIDRFIEVTPE